MSQAWFLLFTSLLITALAVQPIYLYVASTADLKAQGVAYTGASAVHDLFPRCQTDQALSPTFMGVDGVEYVMFANREPLDECLEDDTSWKLVDSVMIREVLGRLDEIHDRYAKTAFGAWFDRYHHEFRHIALDPLDISLTVHTHILNHDSPIFAEFGQLFDQFSIGTDNTHLAAQRLSDLNEKLTRITHSEYVDLGETLKGLDEFQEKADNAPNDSSMNKLHKTYSHLFTDDYERIRGLEHQYAVVRSDEEMLRDTFLSHVENWMIKSRIHTTALTEIALERTEATLEQLAEGKFDDRFSLEENITKSLASAKSSYSKHLTDLKEALREALLHRANDLVFACNDTMRSHWGDEGLRFANYIRKNRFGLPPFEGDWDRTLRFAEPELLIEMLAASRVTSDERLEELGTMHKYVYQKMNERFNEIKNTIVHIDSVLNDLRNDIDSELNMDISEQHKNIELDASLIHDKLDLELTFKTEVADNLFLIEQAFNATRDAIMDSIMIEVTLKKKNLETKRKELTDLHRRLSRTSIESHPPLIAQSDALSAEIRNIEQSVAVLLEELAILLRRTIRKITYSFLSLENEILLDIAELEAAHARVGDELASLRRVKLDNADVGVGDKEEREDLDDMHRDLHRLIRAHEIDLQRIQERTLATLQKATMTNTPLELQMARHFEYEAHQKAVERFKLEEALNDLKNVVQSKRHEMKSYSYGQGKRNYHDVPNYDEL